MSDEQIKTIKLTDDVLEKINIESKDIDIGNGSTNNESTNNESEYNKQDHKYKTEYKISPSLNENIYKLDPMFIIGIGLLIALLIYIGYKFSEETIESENN